MTLSTTTSGVAAAAAACAFATAFVACAAPTPMNTVEESATLRIVVELVRPAVDGEAIAADAARIAGMSVRYAAAISPTRHVLFVQCGGSERCDAVLARLRANATLYRAVEIDGRKTRSTS